jgi:MoaA/NifB/PqqE/SkfB family radical SAM enzyme
MNIGHLYDSDLLDKIDRFDGNCFCEKYKLTAGKGEKKYYSRINIELSYKCQSKCAMCCVNAPDYGGEYDFKLYGALRTLITSLRPQEILVQGGEILVQPDSLNWLEDIKKSFPLMDIAMVTNGNHLIMADYVCNVINRITVSFVGFQSETYRAIMGMDIEKTKKFCEHVIKSGKTRVFLKYLITPNNLHELPLFLEWAICLAPEVIYFADANTKSYIKENTPDRYWDKIIKRTVKEVTKVLLTNRAFLEKELNNRFERISIGGGMTSVLLGMDESYIEENGLEMVLTIDKY